MRREPERARSRRSLGLWAEPLSEQPARWGRSSRVGLGAGMPHTPKSQLGAANLARPSRDMREEGLWPRRHPAGSRPPLGSPALWVPGATVSPPDPEDFSPLLPRPV